MTAPRPARLLAALLAGCLAIPALAGESVSEAGSTLRPADPCLFFRGQAYKRSIDDFTTEMLLACEVIARRRAAGVPLSDRLTATEAMLETYREAVLAARPDTFDGSGTLRWELGLTAAQKHAIADETGMLLALEAIRHGF
jgi:hypothetical protein